MQPISIYMLSESKWEEATSGFSLSDEVSDLISVEEIITIVQNAIHFTNLTKHILEQSDSSPAINFLLCLQFVVCFSIDCDVNCRKGTQ